MMCLSVKVSHPDCVLSEGTQDGFKWATAHNGMGVRCGYVRIPEGHPWHGGSERIDAEVHGGITFENADSDNETWWIGFDCLHAGDTPDPELPGSEFWPESVFKFGTIRDQAYVESECRSLCEQAKEAA